MSNKIVSALFEARQNMTSSLAKAARAVEDLDDEFSQVNQRLNLLKGNTQLTEQQFDGMEGALRDVHTQAMLMDDRLEEARETVASLGTTNDLTADQARDVRRAFIALNTQTQKLDFALGSAEEQLYQLSNASNLTDKSVGRIAREMGRATGSAYTLSNSVNAVTRAMQMNKPPAESMDDSMNKVARSIDDVGDEARETAAELGLLATVAQSTSFEFSSLSVNIGPFNVGLENILVQLPAILTGMGSLLSVVTSLASAFLVLGGTMTGLLAGGALTFFEDFSQQFESTAEAVEAFMAALRELFTDAMAPLMNEANMDLFIESINMAARVVNRFAQFFNQMRDDVLVFFDEVKFDAEAFFEALHDSFVMIRPVLVDFVNFFTTAFPSMLIMFTKVTINMQKNISGLIDSFGNLFVELINFAQVILGAVAPVISAVVTIISDFFAIVNLLPDGITVAMIQLVALAAVFARIGTIAAGLSTIFEEVLLSMKAQALEGSFLAKMYLSIRNNAIELAIGEQSLAGAYSDVSQAMRINLARSRELLFQRIQNNKVIQAQAANMKALAAQHVANGGAVSGLASAYLILHSNLAAVVAGEISLQTALSRSKVAIVAQNAALFENIGLTLSAIPGTTALATAYTALAGAAASAAFAIKMAAIAIAGTLVSALGPVGAAIVIAGAAIAGLVAIFNQMDAITQAVSDTITVLSNSINFLIDLIAAVVIPVINVFVATLELLVSPIIGILSGIWDLYVAFLSFFGAAEDSESALKFLTESLMAVADAIGLVINIFAVLIEGVASFITSVFAAPFRLVADLIVFVGDLLRGLFSLFSGGTSGSGGGFFGAIINSIKGLIGLLTNVDMILDKIINAANMIPGVNIDGPALRATRAKSQIDSETDPQKTDDIQTNPNVNLSFEEKLEQQVNVQADPEDKEGLRRIVKDAMNEANSIARRQEGVGR